jgi:hypothetical protein
MAFGERLGRLKYGRAERDPPELAGGSGWVRWDGGAPPPRPGEFGIISGDAPAVKGGEAEINRKRSLSEGFAAGKKGGKRKIPVRRIPPETIWRLF